MRLDKILYRRHKAITHLHVKIGYCKGRSDSSSRLSLRVKLQGNQYCVMTGAYTRWYTENDDNRITMPL